MQEDWRRIGAPAVRRWVITTHCHAAPSVVFVESFGIRDDISRGLRSEGRCLYAEGSLYAFTVPVSWGRLRGLVEIAGPLAQEAARLPGCHLHSGRPGVTQPALPCPDLSRVTLVRRSEGNKISWFFVSGGLEFNISGITSTCSCPGSQERGGRCRWCGLLPGSRSAREVWQVGAGDRSEVHECRRGGRCSCALCGAGPTGFRIQGALTRRLGEIREVTLRPRRLGRRRQGPAPRSEAHGPWRCELDGHVRPIQRGERVAARASIACEGAGSNSAPRLQSDVVGPI